MDVERLAYVEGFAGANSNHRSVIPHPQLYLLQKPFGTDTRYRLLLIGAEKLGHVRLDCPHLVVSKIGNINDERRNDQSGINGVH